MKKPPSLLPSRRQALAGAGTVGALAAVAAVLPAAREAAKPAADAASGPTADADGRYQVTQHVLRYYETTRV